MAYIGGPAGSSSRRPSSSGGRRAAGTGAAALRRERWLPRVEKALAVHHRARAPAADDAPVVARHDDAADRAEAPPALVHAAAAAPLPRLLRRRWATRVVVFESTSRPSRSAAARETRHARRGSRSVVAGDRARVRRCSGSSTSSLRGPARPLVRVRHRTSFFFWARDAARSSAPRRSCMPQARPRAAPRRPAPGGAAARPRRRALPLRRVTSSASGPGHDWRYFPTRRRSCSITLGPRGPRDRWSTSSLVKTFPILAGGPRRRRAPRRPAALQQGEVP